MSEVKDSASWFEADLQRPKKQKKKQSTADSVSMIKNT